MRLFNEHLNRDITFLKTLHAKKDKADFKRIFNEVMHVHNISKATVYREMKKSRPGLYKLKNYNPPVRKITEREISMVKELLLAGTPVMEIAEKMEDETGEKYGWDRVDKIRKTIDARAAEDPEYMTKPPETEFGENAKDFTLDILTHTLKLDKMSPRSFIEFAWEGKIYRLSRDALVSIRQILVNENPPPRESVTAKTKREHRIRIRKLHTANKMLIDAATRGEIKVSPGNVNTMAKVQKQMQKMDKEIIEIMEGSTRVKGLPPGTEVEFKKGGKLIVRKII